MQENRLTGGQAGREGRYHYNRVMFNTCLLCALIDRWIEWAKKNTFSLKSLNILYSSMIDYVTGTRKNRTGVPQVDKKNECYHESQIGHYCHAHQALTVHFDLCLFNVLLH